MAWAIVPLEKSQMEHHTRLLVELGVPEDSPFKPLADPAKCVHKLAPGHFGS